MKVKFSKILAKEDGGAGAGAAPTNSAGSGAVAGIGVGTYGEPGVSPMNKYKKKNAASEKNIVMGSLLKRK